MPIPRIKPKGKFGGSSTAINESLEHATEALDGEGKIAETVLGKLDEAFKKENESEVASINKMSESMSSSSSTRTINRDTSASDKAERAQEEQKEEAQEKENERIEQEQEEQKEEAEETAEITEEKREKIEKLKQERDAKIEAYRSGSKKPPFLGFFMKDTSLYLMGLVDFAVGWIPVAGDIISFLVSATFWAIPSIMLFDLMAYIRIFLFLVFDMVVGMIPGIGDFADLAPEFLLAKWGPPAQLRKSWEAKIPAILERIRQDYDHRIAIVEANERDKLKKRLARIRGHFSGLAAENQKIVFLLAFIGIIVLGPFGIGAFSETHLLSSLPVVIVITLLLFLGTKLGMLEQKEMFGLLLFLVLNIVLSLLIKTSYFLTQFFGSNTIIVMTMFFAFSFLFVLKTMDVISSRTIAIIMVLLILFLSSFHLFGYFSSDRFSADKEQSVAEQKANWENANLLEKMQIWITEQRLKGKGEYLPEGETEQTYEFMGVSMNNPEPIKEVFYSTEPVQIDIDYQANSYQPISISTSCRTGTYMGLIQPTYPVEATASFFPRVSCIFESLPPGSHNIDVKGVYNYRSTVRLPIKIVSSEFEKILLAHEEDAGTNPAIANFLKESSAVTSAGPIQIGVSNTKEMGANVLKMPMAMDPEAISSSQERRIHKLKFQLQNSYDKTGGVQKIERVTRAQFNMPEGLALSNCNFAPGMNLQPLTENGRWIYNVLDDFRTWDVFTTIECDVAIDPSYVNVYFPEGVGWSKSTMLFTVDYDYSIQKSVAVRVEA